MLKSPAKSKASSVWVDMLIKSLRFSIKISGWGPYPVVCIHCIELLSAYRVEKIRLLFLVHYEEE